MKILYKEKIGFIGLGKLGLPCAEAIAGKGFDVTGYDTGRVTTDLIIKETIKNLVSDRDIVFVAVPTPHEDGYDGRTPTSHLEPKDFNYDTVKRVIAKCDAPLSIPTLKGR